jgi:hypothetical protein
MRQQDVIRVAGPDDVAFAALQSPIHGFPMSGIGLRHKVDALSKGSQHIKRPVG